MVRSDPATPPIAQMIGGLGVCGGNVGSAHVQDYLAASIPEERQTGAKPPTSAGLIRAFPPRDRGPQAGDGSQGDRRHTAQGDRLDLRPAGTGQDRRHRPRKPRPPAEDSEDLGEGDRQDRPGQRRDVAATNAGKERGRTLQRDRQDRREEDGGDCVDGVTRGPIGQADERADAQAEGQDPGRDREPLGVGRSASLRAAGGDLTVSGVGAGSEPGG